MDYVIGIDGGGTKAHLCAVGIKGRLLFETFGGGTNLCSGSEEMVRKTIHTIIGDCIKEVGHPPKAICIGSAGIVNDFSKDKMKGFISDVAEAEILVLDDSKIALRANLDNEAGISITAGTGTICLAQDGRGNYARVSGWGHIFSDEGSAYDISRKAGEKICLSNDGMIPPTLLTKVFMNALDVDSFEDFIAKIYAAYTEKDRLASLASLVDRAFEQGDEAATDVLNDAADNLFKICQNAAGKLFSQLPNFKVVCNGGILINCVPVRCRFEALMLAEYGGCEIVTGTKKAVWGAVKYAYDMVAER